MATRVRKIKNKLANFQGVHAHGLNNKHLNGALQMLWDQVILNIQLVIIIGMNKQIECPKLIFNRKFTVVANVRPRALWRSGKSYSPCTSGIVYAWLFTTVNLF